MSDIDFERFISPQSNESENIGTLDISSEIEIRGDASDEVISVNNVLSGVWTINTEMTLCMFDILSSSERSLSFSIYIVHESATGRKLDWMSSSHIMDGMPHRIYIDNGGDGACDRYVLYIGDQFDGQNGPFISLSTYDDRTVGIKIDLMRRSLSRRSETDDVDYDRDTLIYKISVNRESIDGHIVLMKRSLERIIDFYAGQDIDAVLDNITKDIDDMNRYYEKCSPTIRNTLDSVSMLRDIIEGSIVYLHTYRDILSSGSLYDIVMEFDGEIWIHPDIEEEYISVIDNWNGIRNSLFRMRAYVEILNKDEM